MIVGTAPELTPVPELLRQAQLLQAEVNRLRSIINDATAVIDSAWGGPCGEPLADIRTILSRA